METRTEHFECAVIGGGLAGLCLAIQLADRGVAVVVFEKGRYPFHKVCGEYISMESWPFLESLGLPLADLALPKIDHLGISSDRGFILNHSLGMGGFGISRYSLDSYLFEIASRKGVRVVQECRVTNVQGNPADGFEIHTTAGGFTSKVVCGSYGKYTPQFVHSQETNAPHADNQNYIGVKYHIQTDFPADRIELHNFRDGYCGISTVDNGWRCLCYLTTARNLLENGKDVKQMEEVVLFQNPFLKNYFQNSEFLNVQPLIISNVQFEKKQTDSNGIFLLGDAAGSITPLCGNGMSMGMRASKMLAEHLILLFNGKQNYESALQNYHRAWDAAFGTRIRAGYHLQKLFGKSRTTDLALKALDISPWLTSKLVALTHGDVF
ncbi:NAD(P)/FAD-dependent oxidoreductase [Dyadobacter fermentans]|uniref:NAD(P)/FAD-dependent oxidoreductase n=1 Tax=Dyadobacter fermentans TaxID=94254 RepID=UPI001CBC98D4|nr:NAD(P)/FAD-dependent oxidoreductase [Dyadobacter fermentans]MBZ1360307.1 NAD(P)/FAD-dependent oxidoreductase [Dyadobacter fermentans]